MQQLAREIPPSMRIDNNYSTPLSSPLKDFKDHKLLLTDGTNSSHTNETEALTGSTPASTKSSASSRNSLFSISPYARGSVQIGTVLLLNYNSFFFANIYYAFQ